MKPSSRCRWFWNALLLGCLFGLAPLPPALAAIILTDDLGQRIELEAPARRIVSLSPHITELLFAAGAGDRIVAAVDYSDYPEAARRIPRIGDALRIDHERLLTLEPDLVIAWGSGTPARELDGIRRLGAPLYLSEPQRLADVGDQLRAFGRLAGTEAAADAQAEAFEGRLAALRDRYAGRARQRVFYQLALQPLLTVNGAHIISDVLDLCGGDNLFAQLADLTPRVDIEAVTAAQPRAVIFALYPGENAATTKDFWTGYGLPATTRFIAISGDYIHRPTPRILEGAQRICAGLAGLPE